MRLEIAFLLSICCRDTVLARSGLRSSPMVEESNLGKLDNKSGTPKMGVEAFSRVERRCSKRGERKSANAEKCSGTAPIGPRGSRHEVDEYLPPMMETVSEAPSLASTEVDPSPLPDVTSGVPPDPPSDQSTDQLPGMPSVSHKNIHYEPSSVPNVTTRTNRDGVYEQSTARRRVPEAPSQGISSIEANSSLSDGETLKESDVPSDMPSGQPSGLTTGKTSIPSNIASPQPSIKMTRAPVAYTQYPTFPPQPFPGHKDPPSTSIPSSRSSDRPSDVPSSAPIISFPPVQPEEPLLPPTVGFATQMAPSDRSPFLTATFLQFGRFQSWLSTSGSTEILPPSEHSPAPSASTPEDGLETSYRSMMPSATPSSPSPSILPSLHSFSPSILQSVIPSETPSPLPSDLPTIFPTVAPSSNLSSKSPSYAPSGSQSFMPSEYRPSEVPTFVSSSVPSSAVSSTPSVLQSSLPSSFRTATPSTDPPSGEVAGRLTFPPSYVASFQETAGPTNDRVLPLPVEGSSLLESALTVPTGILAAMVAGLLLFIGALMIACVCWCWPWSEDDEYPTVRKGKNADEEKAAMEQEPSHHSGGNSVFAESVFDSVFLNSFDSAEDAESSGSSVAQLKTERPEQAQFAAVSAVEAPLSFQRYHRKNSDLVSGAAGGETKEKEVPHSFQRYRRSSPAVVSRPTGEEMEEEEAPPSSQRFHNEISAAATATIRRDMEEEEPSQPSAAASQSVASSKESSTPGGFGNFTAARDLPEAQLQGFEASQDWTADAAGLSYNDSFIIREMVGFADDEEDSTVGYRKAGNENDSSAGYSTDDFSDV